MQKLRRMNVSPAVLCWKVDRCKKEELSAPGYGHVGSGRDFNTIKRPLEWFERFKLFKRLKPITVEET
jgi:hypothetical protein